MAKEKSEISQSVIPSLLLNNAGKAIDLYKKALGATEVYRMDGKDGKIMHACIKIGNTQIFLGDTNPQMSTPTSSSFYVYIPDVDASFKQAKQAGLTETWPVSDMFWGDRMGALTDPFGIKWTLATHVKDVSPEEMEKGQKEFEAKMKASKAA